METVFEVIYVVVLGIALGDVWLMVREIKKYYARLNSFNEGRL